MQSSFSARSKRCVSFIKTFGRVKKVLQYITIFWKCILHIPKNVYDIKYLPFDLAVIYKSNLECLESRKHCEANMDDLLLFTPTKKLHMVKLEDLLKAILKNGLKISPQKCQLFRTELQYMGNIIFIKDKRVCVKPLRNRIETILKLDPPEMPKGCRSFAGMVNFLGMFCPELQKLLKPIYDLTRKGRHFIWGKEQQEAFEEIKRLVKAPVLHMPNCEGRFHLYSDTSKSAAGSTLYQIQNGKPKLITYVSKRLPETVMNYSITEL